MLGAANFLIFENDAAEKLCGDRQRPEYIEFSPLLFRFERLSSERLEKPNLFKQLKLLTVLSPV
jgi:hypothetical protein